MAAHHAPTDDLVDLCARLSPINRLALFLQGAKIVVKAIPWPVRISLSHGALTLATISQFPPPPETPPIALPIVWAGSLAITITGVSLSKLFES